jgi:hypothetical protein
MSPQPLRGKDAKVEGRDPPEPAKETMTNFKSLLGRLLRVTPQELREQNQRHRASAAEGTEGKLRPKKVKMASSLADAETKPRSSIVWPR